MSPRKSEPLDLLPSAAPEVKVDPDSALQVGMQVVLSYRGSPNTYPAWVTSVRGAYDRETAPKVAMTMLWDRGSGVAIVLDPVHWTRRRPGTKQSWWAFADEETG